MMDEEIRQAVSEVREMKQMCGNINMKLTNIVTQRGQDWKAKLEAEYQRGLDDGKQTAVGAAELREKLEYQKGFEDGKAISDKGCEGCKYEADRELTCPCYECANNYKNKWTAKDDKIAVGDEVVDSSGKKGLVVSDGNKCSDTIWLLINGYRVPQSVCKENYTKTGRHFDIQSILEAMKA